MVNFLLSIVLRAIAFMWMVFVYVLISVIAHFVIQFVMNGTKPTMQGLVNLIPRPIVAWYYRLTGQYHKSESI